MHFEVRALDRLRVRTRRRVGSTRRRGNHMHDHSRFQRDINDVTGVSLSLSLSLPLTKVTDAQYRKRFRLSGGTTAWMLHLNVRNTNCLIIPIPLPQHQHTFCQRRRFVHFDLTKTRAILVETSSLTKSVLVLRERNWYYNDNPARENLFTN